MEKERVLESQEGLLTLLRDWREYAEWAREIHNVRQSRYAYLNFGFGIPIAVLSITVSTGTVAFLGETIGTPVRVFGAVFSLLAGVLAALQTFIKPSERSMERQIAACGCYDLVREVDQCLANPPDSVEELDQAVKEYGHRLETPGEREGDEDTPVGGVDSPDLGDRLQSGRDPVGGQHERPEQRPRQGLALSHPAPD